MKLGHWKSMAISGALTLCCAQAAHAGWVTVSDTSTPVLTSCNPKPFTVPAPSTCLLTGNTLLAALGSGIILSASQSSSININSVTVGTLYDRAYCYGSAGVCATSGANANTYIFAARVRLNSNAWNGHNSESFEINDIIRKIVNPGAADSAYWMGPTTGGSTSSSNPDLALANQKWLEYTGKTQYGLNDTLVGTRDNNYIDHRQDVNANDPDGVSSQWGAFLLVKQVCPNGITSGTFTIKLWEGGEEAQDHYTQWMSGYKCA